MESIGLPLVSGSLATRHRPRRFADVVGQRHVKVPLQRAIASRSLPQQLLFSGGSGLGKTTLARICAAALLCESKEPSRSAGDCCGICPGCLDVAMGTHPDVIEVDAASNGRVDEIRELASRAYLAPMRGSHRIYIIDEAHGLSAAGGQAFLKLLEEPPAHVIFMLATTDPEKMLHTNRSRCTEFELAPPSRQEFVDNILRVAAVEGVSISELTASEVVSASASELGLRGTLMSLEKILPSLREDPNADTADLLGRPSYAAIADLCSAISSGDSARIVATFSTLRARFPVPQLLSSLADLLNFNLVEASLNHPTETQRYLEASVIAVSARRDGSDLAALVAVLQLSGTTLRFPTASNSTPTPTPVVSPPPQINKPDAIIENRVNLPKRIEVDKDITDGAKGISGSARVSATETGRADKNNSTAQHSTSQDTARGIQSSIASSPPPPPSASPTREVSSLYAVDPWAIPDPIETPLPTPPASSNDVVTAQASFLGALAAQKTPQSRRLQATVRTLSCRLEDTVLVIEAPASTLKILETQHPILAEAANVCGLTLKLSPRQ